MKSAKRICKVLEREYHHSDTRNIPKSMSNSRSYGDIHTKKRTDFNREQAKADRATISAAVDRFKIVMSVSNSRSNSVSGN